jgi:hypothetical protein
MKGMSVMNAEARHFIQGVIFALGLGIMVAGIIAETHGATVIGLIVAAVSFGSWQKWRKT